MAVTESAKNAPLFSTEPMTGIHGLLNQYLVWLQAQNFSTSA